jgi:plastocyanin
MPTVRQIAHEGKSRPGTSVHRTTTYRSSMVGQLSRLDAHPRSILTAAAIGGLMLFAIGPVDAATVDVQAVNYEFLPASRTVTVDDTVRWTFTGEIHTVTSGVPGVPVANGFNSGQRDGGSFEVKFERPGTFPYFCEIHSEQMFGTITVKAATATPRPTPRPTPTQEPTARPTQRPTARPTTAATETPSGAPSATPTALPTESPVASVPPTASPTPSPTASSSGPAATPSQTPAPTPAPDTGAASSSLDPVAVIAGAVVIGLLGLGGFALARRSRSA